LRRRQVAEAVTSRELLAFRRGEEVYFRKLIDAYSPRLLACARSFLPDLDEARDVVQDVWVRAYERRRSYSGSGSLLAWLLTICRNASVSAIRSGTVRERAKGTLGAEREVFPGAGDDPSTQAHRAELRELVYGAVADLPERQRAVVTLRILEGRTTAQAAEALGIAVGTVKATLHQALRNLASNFGDSDHDALL
jgi:RNA polymerase sigma-70 factor, ECF subfamily